MGNWSELPPDILHSISLQIDNPFDLIHFRSVCSSWRSFSILKFRHMPPIKCPLPLDSGGYGDDCHILSSRVYLLKSSPNSSTPKYWLFKLHGNENGETFLHSLFSRRAPPSEYKCMDPSLSLNLLNCQIFELAQEHVASFSAWWILLAVVREWIQPIGFMGLDVKNNNFMIFGKLSFSGLAVYRSVHEHWTEFELIPVSLIEGVVSFKGKVYMIDCTGRTIVIEPTLQVTTFQRFKPYDKTKHRWVRRFNIFEWDKVTMIVFLKYVSVLIGYIRHQQLLKLGDKLLLVELCAEYYYELFELTTRDRKIWFEISELDEKTNDWNQVEDVGGFVLFLDTFCSFSCLATEIPGFRANSIIFMDMWGGCNSFEHESILVFEFNEHGVRSLSDIPEYIELFPTPPGWVISNE